MWNTDQQEFFRNALFQTTGKEVSIEGIFFTSGGCINNAAQLHTAHGRYFIKWNEMDQREMFEAESAGLELLRGAGTFRVPEVIGFGRYLDIDFLILEFIDSNRENKDFWTDFGRSLADLHIISQSQFGLPYDNFIGRLHQKNTLKDNWLEFFIENRLEVQIELCFYKGLVEKSFLDKFRNIYKKLESLLPQEKPSLLHGDLWSGNFLLDERGKPTLIDPAVYYGSREAELAFTKLFGGFEDEFYKSYNDAFPLLKGFDDRVEIYNIYPLLVHVNLFGSSYLSPVERIVKRLQ